MSVHPFTGHEWFPYLYSVGVDGGAGVKLVRGASDGRHPVANDGTIVFTSPGPANDITTTDAPRDVYTMSPDGTSIKQLTHFTGPISFQTPWASLASITPDGKRILFIAQVSTGAPGAFEVLETYGIGGGVTTPPIAAGQPAPVLPLALWTGTLRVALGYGVDDATVLWAGAAPGTAGLYQVNIQLPRQIPRTQFIPPLGVQWLGTGSGNAGCIVPVR